VEVEGPAVLNETKQAAKAFRCRSRKVKRDQTAAGCAVRWKAPEKNGDDHGRSNKTRTVEGSEQGVGHMRTKRNLKG
jgi:hypothetical protein